jgi:hypothetical protein
MRSQVNLGARLDFVSIHQDVSICPQEIPAEQFSVRSSSGVIVSLSYRRQTRASGSISATDIQIAQAIKKNNNNFEKIKYYFKVPC